MAWPNAARRLFPGTDHTRSGVLPTMTGAVASSSPTTYATRYVDIEIVSAKQTTFLPRSVVSETTRVFETAVSAGSITSVDANTALKSGSSQQGNARRASVASNCVAASVRGTPAGSLYVLR